MSNLQSFFDDVKSQLRDGRLTISDEEFFDSLMIDGSQFIDHEGEIWDFKETWPHSYSDPYFWGLAKHVCGFANNMGGLLIFNVKDETRHYHESKIRTNFDRFSQAIAQSTEPCPKIELRNFAKGAMRVPVIVIFPNAVDSLPSALSTVARTKLTKWPIRSGSQTIDAVAKDIPTLFCRPQVRGNEEAAGVLSSALPPSPATMKHFVRRNEIMTRVFAWLHDPRQPRTFLYGRGGSGKTTIAYEVARHIAEYGVRISGAPPTDIEIVIFISAKQTELDVFAGENRSFIASDFSDTQGLLKAIIILSGWNPDVDVDSMSKSQMMGVVSDIFDNFSIFLVVDDIDTITTKGEDAGLEDLFLVVARARQASKILYTMRNVPTYAIANAIEVPGLSVGDEVSEFFSLCARKFNVPLPNEGEQASLLKETEGRPLAIESVFVLRRSLPSYDRAISAFAQHAGDGARGYVFQREWDALSANNRSRSVLTALALLKNSIHLDGLGVILSFDEDVLRESIAEALEMFIDVDETPSGSIYGMGSLTRAFVLSQARNLDRFETIKARVDNYTKTFHPKLPQLNVLRSKVERLWALAFREKDNSYHDRAWMLLHDITHPASLSEAPAFKELLGEVAVRSDPPKLGEAREAFYYANSMKYPVETSVLRLWFNAEARSGAGAEHCPRILEIVKAGRSYTTYDVVDFMLLECSRRYQLAKDMRFEIAEKANEMLIEASLDYLRCLRLALGCNHIRIAKIEEYARNTAYLMLHEIYRGGDPIKLASFLDRVTRLGECVVDPLYDPMIEYCVAISTLARTKESAGRLLNALGRFTKFARNESVWDDTLRATELDRALTPVLNSLALRMKGN